MPLYKYKCPQCGPVERIVDASQRDVVTCKRCSSQLKPAPTGSPPLCLEILDNGLIGRETIRPAEAQRLFAEREIEHDRLYGDGRIPDEDQVPIDDGGDPV